MKHVVFLVGAYYPKFSAVGYCAYQVQKCLANEFKISVISFRNDEEIPITEPFEEHRIYRVETLSMRLRNRLVNASGALAKFGLVMLRGLEAFRRLISPTTIDKALVRAFKNRLDKLEEKPDALVPFVFPFETALAAMDYCSDNRNVGYYPYLFDNFVDSDSLHVLGIAKRMKRSRHLRMEHKMLQKADGILSMHPLREHYKNNFDGILLEKIEFLEHPLLVRPAPSAGAKDMGVLKMCFTGSLVSRVREPEYLLDLLRAVKTPIPLRAEFFVMGNAANRVKTEEFSKSGRIVNHGHVGKHVADAAVCKADILLNIGEIRGKQISSKIFEYISSGKPIIHLASVDDDVTTKILEKYPLALCLVQRPEKFEENVNRVARFLGGGNLRTLPFANVASIYPEALPATSASILEKLINKRETS